MTPAEAPRVPAQNGYVAAACGRLSRWGGAALPKCCACLSKLSSYTEHATQPSRQRPAVRPSRLRGTDRPERSSHTLTPSTVFKRAQACPRIFDTVHGVAREAALR